MGKDKEKTETVYCLKYALTQGIFTIKGYELDSGSFMATSRYYQSFSSSNWTRCPKEAIHMAETLRKKKITLLRKQIVRLQAVEFKVPE